MGFGGALKSFGKSVGAAYDPRKSFKAGKDAATGKPQSRFQASPVGRTLSFAFGRKKKPGAV